MKKLFSALMLVTFAGLLSGCGPERLSSRVSKVDDLGSTPLPNSTDRLHGYRIDNGMFHYDHFVYVVERAGQPIAGTSSNQYVSTGKSGHTLEITSVVRDAPAAKSPAP